MSGKFGSLRDARALSVWLIACVAMVALMMLIGAITRLTESGLSMVEWRPLIGALPPFSTAEWERVFDLYKQTSEYRLENAGMTLAEFKTIFWWEYIHRLWGRLIGLVYGIPFFWFLWRGKLPHGMKFHFALLLLLGAAQGGIGWWMVKSGFVDRHDVSQYRLTVHLAMAFLILGYLLWLLADVLGQNRPRLETSHALRRATTLLLVLISVTVLSGGLVAGLGAGFDYNSWPLMDGALVPAGLFDTQPWWQAAFESILTVQFNHRILAYATVATALGVFFLGRPVAGSGWQETTLLLVAIAAVLQLVLGISALLTVVMTPVAVLHQAGAILLFSTAVLARHAFR